MTEAIRRWIEGAPFWCALFHRKHHHMPEKAWLGNIWVICTRCEAEWHGFVDDSRHPHEQPGWRYGGGISDRT